MASTVGEMIDALGVTFALRDNQHMTDVLLIARVADLEDGNTGLIIGSSKGLDWILQLGLLAAARNVLEAEPATCEDEDS